MDHISTTDKASTIKTALHDFSYNDATIEAYNSQFEQYIQNTPHGYTEKHQFFLHWIDSSLEFVPKGGTILEIGSGHGRDARYMENKGFTIVRTDAAQAFVDYLNSKGEPATKLNVLRDDIPGQYDMIYADGVLPHFNPEDLRLVLEKIYNALKPDGVFTFNTKQGAGDDWINEKDIKGRYTHYWDPSDFKAAVEESGHKIKFFWDNVSGGDLPNRIWIHAITTKS